MMWQRRVVAKSRRWDCDRPCDDGDDERDGCAKGVL